MPVTDPEVTVRVSVSVPSTGRAYRTREFEVDFPSSKRSFAFLSRRSTAVPSAFCAW